MSIGAGLEFFKTLRVGNCRIWEPFKKVIIVISWTGGFIVRIPWSGGPLCHHSLQALGKDDHSQRQDLIIRCYYPQARMGLIFVIIYLSHAVCQWSLYRYFHLHLQRGGTSNGSAEVTSTGAMAKISALGHFWGLSDFQKSEMAPKIRSFWHQWICDSSFRFRDIAIRLFLCWTCRNCAFYIEVG